MPRGNARPCPPALPSLFLPSLFSSSLPHRPTQNFCLRYVAGLQHVFQSWRKPFNPILGETWAGSLSDGTAVYLEQVAHHPPVSAFEMIGPGGAYTFIGISQPEVGYKGMDVRTTARGARRLAFADGGAISVTFPHYYIRGVVGPGLPRGEMVGAATFTDAAHGLTCVLSFGKSPDPADRGVRLLQRGDTVTGAVYREDGLPAGSDGEVLSRSTSPTRPRAEGGLAATRSRPSLGRMSGFASALSLVPREAELAPRTAVATCKGNWLSHLDWDGVRAWTLAVEQPDEWRPVARPLPSDAGLRADLAALREARAEDDIGADPEGVQRAQRIKEEMERAQRADAKLRKAGGAAA